MTNTSPRRWQIPQLRVTFLLLMVTALLATTSCASPEAHGDLAAVPCPKNPFKKLALSFGANATVGLTAEDRQSLTDALTGNASSSKPSKIVVSLAVNGGVAVCLDVTPMVGQEFLKNSQLPSKIESILDDVEGKLRELAERTPLPVPRTPRAAACPATLTVKFSSGHAELGRGAQRQLTRWYEACSSSPCVIRIRGYASPDGDRRENDDLSQRRVDAAGTFLRQLDSRAQQRIASAQGLGEDKAPNKSWDEKRRAVLTCTTEGTR